MIACTLSSLKKLFVPERTMTTITLKGNPVTTVGSLPRIGTQAPDFTLTKIDLSETGLEDFAGKRIILNIFPSVDTAICSTSVRQFNEKANKLEQTVVLCISQDLPFALKRFCAAENLTNVLPLSAFRHPEFGENYGVKMTDGPLRGLLSRAVVIIDTSGKVIYTQQVPEIADEPNYDAALQALAKLVTM
jgi:thiol peroxidase